MLISVVIPTLNEEEHVARTIASVRAQEGPFEIVVADGGSTDQTCRIASQTARVVTGSRGRAAQMNAGASAASGDVLLFLHADTLLPPGGLRAIREALTAPRTESGAFRLCFDTDTSLLRFYSWCTRLPLRHICFGDRGLFVRRDVFDQIGGFPDIPMFEDLEIVRLLSARGGFRFLPLSVTTSARRFSDQGILRQQLRNTYLWTHYIIGTDPSRLTHLYRYGPSE
ncbi:MAG TPA: TIGR04283 family arsenosugar biosynthesis glycosyltransferase [Rhodothermales bacterium]|nr:TIGR04283 family arsenosugar biosynthesis glycosyltransferase [Rhodothermales bacterium]